MDYAQLINVAVVRHGPGPLQLWHGVFWRETQACTEGRCILLGDSIGEDDFSCDAITCEHLITLFVVPGARQSFFDDTG